MIDQCFFPFIFRKLCRIETFLGFYNQLWFPGPQQRLPNPRYGSLRFGNRTIYSKGETTCLRARKSFTIGRFKRHCIARKSRRDQPFLQQFGGDRLLLAPVLANEKRG